jgi:hypothetical protein
MDKLFQKYKVTRVDGKKDPKGQEYFIFKLDKKKVKELHALLYYSQAIESEDPGLSLDLCRLVEKVMTK